METIFFDNAIVSDMSSVNSSSDGWINFNLVSYTKSQRKASGKEFLKESIHFSYSSVFFYVMKTIN